MGSALGSAQATRTAETALAGANETRSGASGIAATMSAQPSLGAAQALKQLAAQAQGVRQNDWVTAPLDFPDAASHLGWSANGQHRPL